MGERLDFSVTSGDYLCYIRDASTDGSAGSNGACLMRLSSTRVSISSKSFSSAVVTSPDLTSPLFVSAATNDNGSKVILTYDSTLSATTAAPSAFTVTVDSTVNAVTNAVTNGTNVELTLTALVTSNQTITVAYTDPSGADDSNAIQDICRKRCNFVV